MTKEFELLQPFEGCAVVGTRVAITNAGDGLSKALEVEPREWQIGDQVYVILRCDVTKVTYQPAKDHEDQMVRVHTLRATDATVAGDELYGSVETAIHDQMARIDEARRRKEDPNQGVLSDADDFDESDDPEDRKLKAVFETPVFQPV